MSGMEADRTRGTVNRVLLAVTGALATVAGAWVAVVGLEERGTAPPFPPPDLHGAVDAVAPALAPLRDPAWWAVAALVATLAVALVAALWWLWGQAGPGSPRALPLPGDGTATRTRALAAAVAEEAEAVPGVVRARVRLARGRRGRVRARILLILAPHAEPDRVLHGLTGGAVHGLRTSSGAAHLDCAVRLRLPSHRTRRMR